MSNRIEMNRAWAMPNKFPFLITPIKQILHQYVHGEWADPFANDHSPAKYTNDLNPRMSTQYHLDALEFLRNFKNNSLDGILLDPPYSFHQVVQCYEGYGKRKKISMVYDEASRILKENGYAITFGWNSNGVGKKRGMEIIEICLLAHGGSHNDTIVTIEAKIAE